MQNSLDRALGLDAADKLSGFRQQFHIPVNKDGKEKIYFCGNSLGLQPRSTKAYLEQELDDWARLGVDGHLDGKNPWLPYHEALSAPMARVVGAHPSEVVVMNSLTVNLHLLMVSFYRPDAKRYKILIEHTTFPSDIYAVKSQLRFHGLDPDEALLFLQPSEGNMLIEKQDIDKVLEAEGERIALILLGGVNYYTGQYFDLRYITEQGHRYGCVVGFDLAHGAGNIEPDLHQCGADFALWCTYKYMNSGPGSLSGIFVHERHADWGGQPRFEGWWGTNKQERFMMKPQFQSLPGAEGWQLSNPPIMAMAPVRASLEIFEAAGMPALRAKSKEMVEFALSCLDEIDGDKINILVPDDPDSRGCQISLQVKNADKELFRCLEAHDVISDWREPDVIRIAPVPLYNTFSEIFHFSEILKAGLTKI